MEKTIDKQRILKVMQELPEDATVEQAMYKLYMLDQVSKALADNGDKISHEDIKKEFLDN